MNYSELSNLFNRKRILNLSLGFVLGLGIGYFFKDIFLWRRKEEGYLYEILKEIMLIKSDLKKIKIKIKKIDNNKKSIDCSGRNLIVDSDEFLDAESSLDEVESFYSLNDDLFTDVDNFIKEIDDILMDGSAENYLKCHNLCEIELWKYQESGEFLWRYAMIAYHTTILPNFDDGLKKERIFGAFNNALNAVKKSPKSSEAHKWLGILYGVTGMLSDTRKRILNGFKFKEHIDKCLQLNPNDAYAYLLKGRFCYQVSNLAYYERKLASILFETPPVSTLEEAFACFKKCEELSPDTYGENHYFLALCYQSLGDYTQASKLFESAKKLSISDSEIKLKLENS